MEIDAVLHAVLEELGDRYKFIKRLGGGEFSNVYLVKHTISGHERALKIMDYHYLLHRLRKENLTDSKQKFNEIKKRFLTEARLYKMIDHPNIVKIHETGLLPDPKEEIDIPYFIMDYVRGDSLADMIRKEAPFDMERVIHISKNVLEALEVIHKQNIIHRDLKPANIMVRKDNGEAIIIDFGIAKDIVGGTRLTTTGALLGSPMYMSPEQFDDSSNVGPGIDIYAFGAVLFEMMTGQTPYRGSNFIELMNAHTRKPVPSVKTINPALSTIIDNIVLKAMAKDPAARYRSAKEFLDALIRGGAGLRPHPVSRKMIYFTLVIAAFIVLFFFFNPQDPPKPPLPVVVETDPQSQQKDENGPTKNGVNEIQPPPDKPEVDPQEEKKRKEYENLLSKARRSLAAENFDNSRHYARKAKEIDDNEEINKLLEEIKTKKTEYEQKHGVNKYMELKDNITLADYLEFKETYPESKHLQDLKKRLIETDLVLPPESYWLPQLQKNSKGYYELTFDASRNNHHMIYIPARKIWIGKYEVSNIHIKTYLQENPGHAGSVSSGDEFPALVSYEVARNYCRHYGMRLPTTEEWEYAAGKGNASYSYPWGNEAPGVGGVWPANLDSLSEDGKEELDGHTRTAPVKSFSAYASPFGLVNMAGNVWEWIQGYYFKGGGFLTKAEDLLSAIEGEDGGGHDRHGFRCIIDLTK